MDPRDIPQPQQQPGTLMSHYLNSSTSAMTGPNSTSQSIHHRLPFGSLAPHGTLQQQQIDQKTLGYVEEVSPSSQPMRFGIDQSQSEQQQVKRKRGRPRKYAPDGTIALGLAPTSPLLSAGDGDIGRGNTNSVDPPAKRNRGRPPGSIKKQFDILGTPGVGFTPDVIEVNQGEDIFSKVLAYSNQGLRTVSVLSAAGAVSRITLQQASSPSGIYTEKGLFDIVTLSGSFFKYEENNGSILRTGNLTVALARPDGQVLGGSVVGPLVAATPVRVIVGSFVSEAKKPKLITGNINALGQNHELASTPANMLNFGSNSQGPSSESSEENESGSPSTQHHDNSNNGIYGNSEAQQQQLRHMQMYNHWPRSGH